MDLFSELNDMQAEAVAHTDGALLLLAGAGSGKTRVITYRMAFLLERGVDPYNILAITFTNKAAREMKERVSKLSESGSRIWVSTFHSACVRILRRDADKIGYGKNFTIYDADDAERLVKSVTREANLSGDMYSPRSVLGEIGRAKDELLTPAGYAETASGFRSENIVKLYAAYQKKLVKNNGMDFDDIILNAIRLLRENKEVLGHYQKRFKYVMVDEYQDTNTAQYELVRLLSGGGSLCVVGDDDQSIYGWRGANIRNILEFERDFKNAETIRLEQNYRSTGVILAAANAVIANNKSRKGKNLWTDKPGGDLIKYCKAANDDEEAAYIAERIKAASENGGAHGGCAVLYRMNAQSRKIEEALMRRGVPYRVFGGVRFYERREIKDVLAYLRVLENPYDEVSLLRIINVPRRGIGDATVEKVLEYANEADLPLINALREAENYMPQHKAKRVLEFCAAIGGLSEFAQENGVLSVIGETLKRTGYLRSLETEGEEEGQERAANVSEFVSKAAEFEKTSEENTLSVFLAEVSLVADIDAHTPEANAASLMTVHSAKGLEFDTVFLPGFEEGVFPGYRAVNFGTDKDIEEERRLCYVGITRAIKTLYIISAGVRMLNGQQISSVPSRFLKEIPPELIEGMNTKPPAKPAAPSISPRKALPVDKRDQPYKAAGAPVMPAKAEKPDYGVGDKVRQPKYGVGTVLDIAGAGADYEVTVEFPGIGVKKFMAHLSKLAKA